jgi:hypothetical protein
LAPYEQAQPADYPGLLSGDRAQPMSLFDLERDPGEQHNVAAQHGDVVARLKARFDEVVRAFPAAASGPVPPGPRTAP